MLTIYLPDNNEFEVVILTIVQLPVRIIRTVISTRRTTADKLRLYYKKLLGIFSMKQAYRPMYITSNNNFY